MRGVACLQMTEPVRLQRYVVTSVVLDEQLLQARVRSRGTRAKGKVEVSETDARIRMVEEGMFVSDCERCGVVGGRGQHFEGREVEG